MPWEKKNVTIVGLLTPLLLIEQDKLNQVSQFQVTGRDRNAKSAYLA